MDGIDYFVTGGAGKVRPGRPRGFTDARTVKWASAAHFLRVRIEGARAEVVPMGEDGGPLATLDPAGRPVEPMTIVTSRAGS